MAPTGTFTVRIGVEFKAAQRSLERIQRFDIPKAKASAFARAGQSAVSEASTKIAAGARVPRWMIRGVGGGTPSKGSGSRLGRTKYIKKLDGIILFLRHNYVNPVGTMKKQNRVTALKRGGVRVAGVGSYSKGVFLRGPYQGAVYERIAGRLEQVKISLDPWAESVFRNTALRVVPREFKKRFDHEMSRLLKARRGG